MSSNIKHSCDKFRGYVLLVLRCNSLGKGLAAAGLPKLKIEECAARQQAHIDTARQVGRGALWQSRHSSPACCANLTSQAQPGPVFFL